MSTGGWWKLYNDERNISDVSFECLKFTLTNVITVIKSKRIFSLFFKVCALFNGAVSSTNMAQNETNAELRTS